MSKNVMNVAKGVAVGYVSNKVMQKNPKTIKRKANDAISAMGQIVNDISYLLKQKTPYNFAKMQIGTKPVCILFYNYSIGMSNCKIKQKFYLIVPPPTTYSPS